MTKRTKKGFTLIELLVVVLIIGILAGIGAPIYFRSIEESRASEAYSTLSAIAAAQGRNHIRTGSYTTDIKDLDMGFSLLSYFTITQFGQTITVKRTTSAGSGLGNWTMSITMPEIPGIGQATWSCTPTSAGCKSLLPQ